MTVSVAAMVLRDGIRCMMSCSGWEGIRIQLERDVV